jgi:hypothetical protein
VQIEILVRIENRPICKLIFREAKKTGKTGIQKFVAAKTTDPMTSSHRINSRRKKGELSIIEVLEKYYKLAGIY